MNICKYYLPRLLLISGLLLVSVRPVCAANSSLWGAAGELWSPTFRLPDFSHAGYRGGDAAIPDLPVVTNIKNFGARGDGVTDDSAALLAALNATQNGALYIPAGRYKITAQVIMPRSNIVIRGAGVGSTILYFPLSLNDVVGAGIDEAPGGSWSWSGGFFQINGGNLGRKLTTVTAAAPQGNKNLSVADASGLSVGQSIRVITWNNDGTWGRYLLGDLFSNPSPMYQTKGSDFPCKITAIQGNQITIDRPLRTEIRLAWNPEIDSDLPKLQNIGFEDMTLEFPDAPYPGHHNEPGFNGFDFRWAENCWIRRIRFINCDSGIFIHESSWFCTIKTVRFSATSKRFVHGYDYLPDHPYDITGHHGLLAQSWASDNLFQDFQFDVRMIHELSVENQAAGNVFETGRGLDMTIDHHRRGPFANLFTDIDVGQGNRIWEAGGDASDGPESGRWETFWNIRSARAFGLPDKWDFKAILINLIGIPTTLTSQLLSTGNWIDAILPSALVPPDLFLSQLALRQGITPGDTIAPTVPTGLTATAVSPTQINLSWAASTDAVGVVGYNIYVNGALLTATTSRSYSHTGLIPATSYTYSVDAYDAADNTSALSTPSSATTQAATAAPVIFTPTSMAAQVGVPFIYPIGASNGPTSFGATGLPNALTLNPQTGLITGTPTTAGTFAVTISATNAAGTGTRLLTLAIGAATDMIAPSVPTNLTTQATSPTQIQLSWTPSTDNVGVTGYAIYRYGLKVAISPTPTYMDSNLTSSTRYRYAVTAYDAAGNESGLSLKNSVSTLASAIPTVPTRVTISAVSSTQINLSWQASTVTGGTIQGYRIYGNGSFHATTATNQFQDTGLTPATTYTYRIEAYDDHGQTSSLTGPISAMTGSNGIMPTPTLNLPTSIPVNATLSAGYPSQWSQVGFEWTLTPTTPSLAGSASAKASNPAASFRTVGNTANLSSYLLAPGSYLITVRAFETGGRTSPFASANVTLIPAELTGVKVYPNPWRSDHHNTSPITFEPLPIGSSVKLFTVSGHFIRELGPSNGSLLWDLRNKSGEVAASGIYIYLITTPTQETSKGQIILIR